MKKEEIIKLIEVALDELVMGYPEIDLGHPTNEEHGEWSSNIALTMFSKLQAPSIKHQINSKSQMPNSKGIGALLDLSQPEVDQDDVEWRTPRQLAEAIHNQIAKIKDQNEDRYGFIEKIEVAGPGFVNFFLSDGVYVEEMGEIIQKSNLRDPRRARLTQNVVKNAKFIGKRVVVEYSSPNIAKPFTVGHLRSTIIGDAIANLLEVVGAEVYRDSHVGDWGTQFGKQIVAIKKWGDIDELEQMKRPVKKLVELYVKFHDEAEQNPDLENEGREWFKRLEEGDEEARALWQKCVDWSWKEFEVIYQRLGVKITENGGRGYGESYFEDKMGPVIEELEEKGLLKEGDDGARLVFFAEELKMPPAMILKKDGATLYHTRDLATDKFRKEKYGEGVVIINEVGAEQELYFKQLFLMEEMLGWYKPEQRVHVKHGLYKFADKKMSTRKGNVIWLEEVLEEAIGKALDVMRTSKSDDKPSGREGVPEENAKLQNPNIKPSFAQKSFGRAQQIRNSKFQIPNEELEEIAQMVGIGALKWNDLKSDPKKSVVFDWDSILTMEGNSGPYVQYTYARAKSVLRRANEEILRLSDSSHRIRSVQDDEVGLKSLPTSSNLKRDSGVEDNVSRVVEELKLVDWRAMGHELNDEERAVVVQLARFGEVVERAAEELAPHLVCGYVFELAQRFNCFYNKHSILGGAQDEIRNSKFEAPNKSQIQNSKSQTKRLRLGLTVTVAETLKTGLGLLGIGAPRKM